MHGIDALKEYVNKELVQNHPKWDRSGRRIIYQNGRIDIHTILGLWMNMDNTIGNYLKFKCGENNAIESCADIVRNGGVIVYPTDTVYGVGCDPFNEKAVERIFLVKRRVAEKALPVLSASLIDLEDIVELSDKVKRLAR